LLFVVHQYSTQSLRCSRHTFAPHCYSWFHMLYELNGLDFQRVNRVVVTVIIIDDALLVAPVC
jgi:hypothetical protein